ncbi:MAG: biotin--[acetyl-CoA-carboxylase] ligase [Xanthomonadales bacterium]|nr:biotin--[acetyl-CoA-carboxylase] ligase [Xanthomonadales bacterium]
MDAGTDRSTNDQVEASWLVLVERLQSGEPCAIVQAADLLGGPAALDRALRQLSVLGLPLAVDERLGELRWRRDSGALDAVGIAEAAALSGWSCPVEVLALTDSTSTRLAAQPTGSLPRALLAECQWAGRGRRGRQWLAGYGEAILMSVRVRVARPPAQHPGLALAAGCAVAETLAPLMLRAPTLKWPNDLLVGEAKLGGLLVEAAGDGSLVIGLGLNWSLATATDRQLARPVASLAPLLARPATRSDLAGRVLAALLAASEQFDVEGLAAFLARFAALDALAGRRVIVESASGVRAGLACGLARDGALQVDHEGGLVAYHSAEVTLAWR